MDLRVFNEYYLNPLLHKIARENKKIFIIGDFNVDLMETDLDNNTSNYFDTLTSHLINSFNI